MAFTSDITLDDASGDDVVYRLVSQDTQGTRRIDVATTLAAPAYLAMKHSTAGKSGDMVDRHLVQFNRTLVDTNGVPRTLTVNLTLAVPRSSIITSQIVKDQVMNLLDLMSDGALTSLATSANIDSILRGES